MTGGISTGRGGAGNIGTPAQLPISKDPQSTPTIKSDLYTTGRGGTGNMAKNDPSKPEIARAAQDVENRAPPPRDGATPVHFGRGGAANVLTPGSEDEVRKNRERRESESKDLKERGKALLEKVGLKK